MDILNQSISIYSDSGEMLNMKVLDIIDGIFTEYHEDKKMTQYRLLALSKVEILFATYGFNVIPMDTLNEFKDYAIYEYQGLKNELIQDLIAECG